MTYSHEIIKSKFPVDKKNLAYDKKGRLIRAKSPDFLALEVRLLNELARKEGIELDGEEVRELFSGGKTNTFGPALARTTEKYPNLILACIDGEKTPEYLERKLKFEQEAIIRLNYLPYRRSREWRHRNSCEVYPVYNDNTDEVIIWATGQE